MTDTLNLPADVDRAYVEAEDLRAPQSHVIRASSLGKQPRRLVLELIAPEAREKPTGRACRTFEVGKQRHDALRAALVGLCGDSQDRIPVTQDEEEELDEPLGVGDWRIVGHPDGVLQGDVVVNGARVATPALLEIKTVNALGWTSCKNGEIDESYLATSGWYARAARLRARVFLFEKKDTQHLHAIALDHREPLLDRALDWALAAAVQAAAGPTVEQYLKKSEPCQGKDYGWQASRTGPPKLGWRCSYCPFAGTCFPKMVRTVASGKVVCLDESNVPADAYVVSMGTQVVPRGTWKMAEADGD